MADTVLLVLVSLIRFCVELMVPLPVSTSGPFRLNAVLLLWSAV